MGNVLFEQVERCPGAGLDLAAVSSADTGHDEVDEYVGDIAGITVRVTTLSHRPATVGDPVHGPPTPF